MKRLIFQILRLRYFIRFLRAPTNWASLLFMLLTWFISRRRSGR